MTSRQLLTLESSSHQSVQPHLSRPSSQLEPCPSPDCVVDIECSQVDSIARALNTAKVLGRVRRGRLAQSEPPRDRQILERTLKNNLERRLSQISLTGPPQGQSPRFWANSELTNNSTSSQHSPRTSSPFYPPNALAPGTPLTPSSSFDSVFFSDNSELPQPITSACSPQELPLPIQPPSRSTTPVPSATLADSAIMAELDEHEKNLKKVCRRITATMEANPPDILTEVEMIPLYVDHEKELVKLLIDLNLEVQEIFEDFAVALGDTRINSWRAKVSTLKSSVSSYRQSIAAKIKSLKQSSNNNSNASNVNTTQPMGTNSPPLMSSTSVNSSIEQERLTFEKERQQKLLDRLETEAVTRLKAITEDANKFCQKFPEMAEEWTVEDNIKIESAMKDIVNWEKQMLYLKKESREIEIIYRGNKLTDDEDSVTTMSQLIARTEKLMDNSIKQVKFLDSSRNLNSLGTRKVDLVKLPQFAGKSGEDFVTFRKKMEKAFISNRISTDDQVEKLRENLRDGAKLVVPEGMDDIDTAWDVLEAAYGGEDKVMQNRKDKLTDMGSLPEPGVLNKGGQSKRKYFLSGSG